MAYGDAANDVTVTVYNSQSAVGDMATKIVITAALDYGGRDWNRPRWCPNGLYADLSGTNVSAIIEFIKAVQ